MPKLIQITCSFNLGSIGRIAEQINTLARQKGWETWYAYSRSSNPPMNNCIHVGSKLGIYEHYIEHRLFDNEGMASRRDTTKFIAQLEKINPDIIHLHNIHDHWLNYSILFEYLNTIDKPIVWTLHDCWNFTGGCAHFDQAGCIRWREAGCSKGCPVLKQTIMRKLFEKTRTHFELKKTLFTGTKKLTLVPVCHWMESMVKESFLKEKNIVTIQNGIDLHDFRPLESKFSRKKYGIGESDYVIGVSSVWLPYKGWLDFLKLVGMLPASLKLVLVGLDRNKVVEAEKKGIIGIPRTGSVEELASLYSGAVCFCNLTYEDTFPTTNLESLACGTPVITYQTGGSPEAVSEQTGFVVGQGDLDAVCKAIDTIRAKGKSFYVKACRERAENCFNKEDRFEDYMRLYEVLLNSNNV